MIGVIISNLNLSGYIRKRFFMNIYINDLFEIQSRKMCNIGFVYQPPFLLNNVFK